MLDLANARPRHSLVAKASANIRLGLSHSMLPTTLSVWSNMQSSQSSTCHTECLDIKQPPSHLAGHIYMACL